MEVIPEYSIAFATGTLLLPVLYPRIRERYAFTAAYCVFFAGVLLFCFRHASSILCALYPRCSSVARSLQGTSIGVLLPWTVLLHVQRSNPGKRVQTHFILLLICVGSFAIGYLIRLIGGLVEQILIVSIFSLLCFLGLFMFFFDDTPERLILRNRSSLAASDPDAPSVSIADDLYASLLQSADDGTTSSIDQLIALSKEECTLSRSQLLRRYLSVLVRWLLAVLSITVPSPSCFCPDLPSSNHRPVVSTHRSLLASATGGCSLFRPPLACSCFHRSLCRLPPSAATSSLFSHPLSSPLPSHCRMRH